MKLVKIKPKLVDPQWFSSSSPPKPKPILIKMQPKSIDANVANFSFYYNLIAILILIGAGYLLYNRYLNKANIDEKKNYEIGKFHRYVTENISN